MALPDTLPPRFTGWWRPGSRSFWHVVCHGQTEPETFRRLRELKQGGDFCCLEYGKNPNHRNR
jgi:hypothetical protein